MPRLVNTLAHKNEFWNFKKVNFADIIFDLNNVDWLLNFSGLD